MVDIAITTFSEEVQSSSVSGAVTLDLNQSNTFFHTITSDVTYSFTNFSSTPPGNSVTLLADIQDGTATVTWPSGVEWPQGSPGEWSDAGSGDKYMYTFISPDGGSTVIGLISGEGIV